MRLILAALFGYVAYRWYQEQNPPYGRDRAPAPPPPADEPVR